MAPNVASNGMVANGNGIHMNGKAPAQSNGNGTAARPAVAPKSTHEDRWAGVERPYSQVRDADKHHMKESHHCHSVQDACSHRQYGTRTVLLGSSLSVIRSLHGLPYEHWPALL